MTATVFRIMKYWRLGSFLKVLDNQLTHLRSRGRSVHPIFQGSQVAYLHRKCNGYRRPRSCSVKGFSSAWRRLLKVRPFPCLLKKVRILSCGEYLEGSNGLVKAWEEEVYYGLEKPLFQRSLPNSSGPLAAHEQTLGLQACKKYLLRGLKYINMPSFGLFGAPGFCQP